MLTCISTKKFLSLSLMSKAKLHIITLVAFAMLIVFSSGSFGIDMHFCQNNLSSVSLFSNAKCCKEMSNNSSCSMEQTSCQKSSLSTECDKDCCSNEAYILTNDDSNVIQAQINSYKNFRGNFLIALSSTFILNNSAYVAPVNFEIDRPPPLSSIDKQIRFQTFLI